MVDDLYSYKKEGGLNKMMAYTITVRTVFLFCIVLFFLKMFGVI
jgi:hypothetical protein